MNLRKAAEMALEAWSDPQGMPKLCKAFDALREALAQPEQEPVVECKDDVEGGVYCVTLVNTAPIGKLYLHPAPIPEGWQLVPKNPTDEMLDAAEDVKQYELGTPRRRWEAMLAAAPKPE